jgi:structure-specific recognition protein 1
VCGACLCGQARDRRVELKKEDVDSEGVEWCKLGSKYQLRLQQSNGSAMRFEGFEAGHHKELKEYCDKTLGAKLSKVALDVEGRNSGKLQVRGDEIVFRSEKGKKIFDMALPNVKSTQCNAEKNDLVLTFEQEESKSKKHEGLLEMRFFVPDTEMADENAEEDAEHEKSVSILHREVLQHVTKEQGGEKMLLLEAVSCRQPRATFEITIFANLFKMHSNTYDFDVAYKNVKRIFKVPSGIGSKPGHYLTLQVDPPLRKGQTHYAYVVLFFESDPDDEPEELRLNLPEDFKTKYKDHPPALLDKIQPKMKGQMVDMFADILRFFATTKDNPCKVLQAKKFQSASNKDPGSGKELPAIKCSIGGWFFRTPTSSHHAFPPCAARRARVLLARTSLA